MLAAVLLIGGCARFDDRLDQEFTPAPDPGMLDAAPPAPRPGAPSFSAPGGGTTTAAPEEPGPCTDPDPAVVATCLEATSAVAGLGSEALLVETGGRALVVAPEVDPVEFGRVDVRGGRVVAVAPSPDFDQDRIVYALVVGGGDSRIEKLARGQTSRTVAELPPADGGGLVYDGDVLTVGVGDRLLSFPDYRGIGTAGRPEVVAGGLGEIRGVCRGHDGVFVTATTDRGIVVRDADDVMWTWPDQREVGGCVATEDALAVALPGARRVDVLPLAGSGPRGEPEPLAEGTYGRLTGLAVVADGVLMSTTTNTDGGEPVPTDDRAVVLPLSGGGADSRV